MSSVCDGVVGGGYDCFPALAAAGIERAAGEGPGERASERAGDREGRGKRLVQLLDGWMDGTEGEGERGVYTTSALTVSG